MIQIDGNSLTIHEVASVSRQNEKVKISAAGVSNIQKSRQVLENILETDLPVYGINTGYGIFADQRIPFKESELLNRNLILSHAVGTGDDLPVEVVRAAMLIRANTLAKGYSGVRQKIVETLVDMLNAGVTPAVPEQGSLGSSGDLGPLSHLALVFTRDEYDRVEESGTAYYQGRRMTGKEAMAAAGIERIVLGPKEGLAINNGATFCAAIAALTLQDARHLLGLANLATAMSLEALQGCSAAFDQRLHEARGQVGQIESARLIREYFEGSTLVDCAERVQDAYSLRCAPQVHGAIFDTIEHAWNVLEREINAATDNPLLFSDGKALSGGNFHGEPIGFVMDFVAIALSELGAISERRIFRMLDGHLNAGLPAMLVDNPDAAGLNSGLMMPHYTAASLALENQALANPNSVHSLPTSAGQEDHNANAMTAARNARMVAKNTLHILATEIFTACRALDLRLRANPESRFGKGSGAAYMKIRSQVPSRDGDHLWSPEIEQVKKMVSQADFLNF